MTAVAVNRVVPQGFRLVGDMRVRENLGMCLDEIEAGLVIEHRPAVTVTEATHAAWLQLTGNPAPVHRDIVFCERIGRDQPLVCGIVALSIVLTASVRSISAMTTANLAMDDVRLSSPVHVGDTLRAETEIVSARPSRSRPGQGVVQCRTTGVNQRDEVVISFTRTFLVPASSATFRATTDY
jgi:itaconyl-CoA hydratase